MTWRSQMGPASFRGVQFHVATSDHSGGRRTIVHEFPGRDEPFAEDLGRAVREFPVEGHVVGADYLERKSALIAALETPGPGELVHPYYGTRRVVAAFFRVRESTAEGGMATFAIDFIESSPSTPQPTSAISTAAAARRAVISARAAVSEEFLDAYVPGAHLEQVASALRTATRAVEGALAPARLEVQALAELRRRAGRLVRSAGVLVREPGVLLASLLALMQDAPMDIIGAYWFPPGARPGDDTPGQRQQRACFDALHRLVQRGVVLAGADALLRRRFGSYDEAVAERSRVTELLDDQAETAPDSVFPALERLRAALVMDVPGEDSDLPRLLSVTPGEAVPSLVLSQRLYGTTGYEPDIVRRNRPPHPGFITGPLQVVSRD